MRFGERGVLRIYVTALALTACKLVGVEVGRVRGDAFAILVILLAPPRESVVKDASKFFDGQCVQDLLCTLVAERVCVRADGRAGHVNDTGVVRKGT